MLEFNNDGQLKHVSKPNMPNNVLAADGDVGQTVGACSGFAPKTMFVAVCGTGNVFDTANEKNKPTGEWQKRAMTAEQHACFLHQTPCTRSRQGAKQG